MINTSFAEALFHKYYKPGARISTKQLEDGSFVITKWEHPDGIPQPNEAAINIAIAEFEADKASEKNARKNRKRDIMTKMGISKADIKALLELIQDGNDD